MYQVIHRSTARVCSALIRAIVDHFEIPERYLLSAFDLASSTPDKKVSAVFFDSQTMLSDHKHAMSAPIHDGGLTIILIGVPPSEETLTNFAAAFTYGMMFAEEKT